MHRRHLPGFVLIAVLIGACSNSAQSPTTLVQTRGTQTLNLELHPRCQMLQVADVSVGVYAGSLALGKCRTKKLVAYADFLTETD